mmetsp:Transcript_41260/g.132649  ORF Transcript_41260/g.132649 Transcript_41260/m.132649 type:complete len:200 (-) Transcript_41260:449-1048(-)
MIVFTILLLHTMSLKSSRTGSERAKPPASFKPSAAVFLAATSGPPAAARHAHPSLARCSRDEPRASSSRVAARRRRVGSPKTRPRSGRSSRRRGGAALACSLSESARGMLLEKGGGRVENVPSSWSRIANRPSSKPGRAAPVSLTSNLETTSEIWYVSFVCAAESGGTPGTSRGPRTRRNASNGRLTVARPPVGGLKAA